MEPAPRERYKVLIMDAASDRRAAGDKIPRKGGPGITKSDLLVINKIDLAPMVGASLEVMERDAKKMRGVRPFVFSNLKTGQGLEHIIDFIETDGLLDEVTPDG